MAKPSKKLSPTKSPEPESATGSDASTHEIAVATPPAETKPVNVDEPHIRAAVDAGLAAINEGKSKADAARVIFDLIKDSDKDAIVAAFVAGATLTPKGALTYWYNCKRRSAKTKG